MNTTLTNWSLAAAIAATSTLTGGALGQVIQEWVMQYDGPDHNSDRIADMFVADDGTFYTVGVTNEGGAGYPDMLVAKYGSDGQPAWIRQWNGPTNGSDYGAAIGVDSQGNVYAGGFAYNGSPGTSFVLAKYDSNGTEQWSRRYWGSSPGGNITYDLAIDHDDNIYLTGYTVPNGASGDVMTLKYNPNGDLLWDRRFNGPYNGWDQGYHMAIDSAGDIVISGRTEVSQYNDNFYVLKYSPAGNLIWMRDFGGPANGADVPDAMAVGSDDSIYLTGYGRQSGYNDDVLVLKYSAVGDLQWSYWYDNPEAMDDRMFGIALDDLNDVYVTGRSERSVTGEDYLTAKIDTNGVEQWMRVHSETDEGEFSDYAVSISLDDTRNVYVTGASARPVPPGVAGQQLHGIGTVSYDTNGNERWSMFLADLNSNASGVFVHAGDDHDVVVGGSKWTQDSMGDCLVVKYLEGDCDANGLPDVDEILADPGLDADGSGILDVCEDRGDFDGDGAVGFTDLLVILGEWGQCPDPPDACPADTDGDGSIGIIDLLVLLRNWG